MTIFSGDHTLRVEPTDEASCAAAARFPGGRVGVTALVVAVALLSACSPRPSVDVRIPAEIPETVLIENVAVLDVEAGVRVGARDVLIDEGFVVAIEPAGSVTPRPSARVISGEGATLVPGLIDAHGHVSVDSSPTWMRTAPDPDANLRSYLYSGVTTILDPADMSGDAFVRRERVARGEVIGPRIYTSGPLLTCPGGHPIALVEELAPWWIGWYLAPRMGVAIGSVEEAAAVVSGLAEEQADIVKIVIDAIPLEAQILEAELAGAIVESARAHGLRVVAHIGTTRDAIAAAEAGVAAWVHGVYKERIPDSQIAVLAGYGIPMVTTTEVFERYARSGEGPRASTKLERETQPAELLDAFHPWPDGFDVGSLQAFLELMRETRAARVDNVRRLHEAGVTILAGSDTQSGVFPGPGLHRELHHLVAAGLTPAEAIRAATLDPARFLAEGQEPDFGAVEVGKRADLLLVDGDPSADVGALENIREVFVAGVPLERVALGE